MPDLMGCPFGESAGKGSHHAGGGQYYQSPDEPSIVTAMSGHTALKTLKVWLYKV